VLVETAFLSNANERQLLVSSKWQEEIADRLFEAFKEYKTIYDASVGAGEMMPDVQEQASSSKVDTEPDAEEYYAVQIMGLARLLKNGDPALKGLEVQAVKAADSNIYKYVCGKHSSKETAAERLAVVKKKFPDAFIVKVTGDKVTRVK
jgi:N-acetylmuramoyl-L-alanine amidase